MGIADCRRGRYQLPDIAPLTSEVRDVGDPASTTHQPRIPCLLIKLYPMQSLAHLGVHRACLREMMCVNHTIHHRFDSLIFPQQYLFRSTLVSKLILLTRQ